MSRATRLRHSRFCKMRDHNTDADRTIEVCRALSITSTGPVTNHFPALASGSEHPHFLMVAHWDFFVTCAGLGTSLLLYSAPARSDNVRFAAALLERARNWNQQATAAILDCEKFVNRNIVDGVHLPAAVGLWTVWNLKGSMPSDREAKDSLGIGVLIVSALRDLQSGAA